MVRAVSIWQREKGVEKWYGMVWYGYRVVSYCVCIEGRTIPAQTNMAELELTVALHFNYKYSAN